MRLSHPQYVCIRSIQGKMHSSPRNFSQVHHCVARSHVINDCGLWRDGQLCMVKAG